VALPRRPPPTARTSYDLRLALFDHPRLCPVNAAVSREPGRSAARLAVVVDDLADAKDWELPMRQTVVALIVVAAFSVAGCGSPEPQSNDARSTTTARPGQRSDRPATTAAPAPADPACRPPDRRMLATIRASLTERGARFGSAWQTKAQDTPGMTFIAVDVRGLPEGAVRGIPIAIWATYRGKVYTADGAAFAISKLPNVNDHHDLIGAGYDAASNTAFDCVKASAGY
jgi:hypothetical protein